MFRQDQIEVAQRLFSAQWEALSATATYKEGRAYLAKWSRSARARYAHMRSSDRELLAIDILEDEWIKHFKRTAMVRKKIERKIKDYQAYAKHALVQDDKDRYLKTAEEYSQLLKKF